MNNLTKKKINALAKGKKKGFTLVELIIVIAIIAILAAIAVPKFAQVTRNANIKADVAAAKTVHEAAQEALAEKPTLTEAELNTDVAGRVQGGMPSGKAVSGSFSITLDSNGDVHVKVGTGTSAKEVYPNMDANYGQ